MLLKRFVIVFFVVVLGAMGLLTGYGAVGYWDASRQADDLAAQADQLIASGSGPENLGDVHLKQLLMVEDPAFRTHAGVDFSSPGAGMTTITQSLSKRLGFEEFKPGIAKIRQTGFAFGLERYLSKDQILALFLNTVEMGPGPDGWMTGMFAASERLYGKRLENLDDGRFLQLLAVLVAPAKYNLQEPGKGLHERTDRIRRLVDGACTPTGWRDVWLQGCEAGRL